MNAPYGDEKQQMSNRIEKSVTGFVVFCSGEIITAKTNPHVL